MEVRTILFIGKPGSGKGTQAKLLSEVTGSPIMSSGDAFRAIAKEDSMVGRRVHEELSQGLLMPEWFAMYLFQKSVFSLSETSSVLFDGFGRKLPEAKMVVDVLSWLGRKLEVVHIRVSDEHILNRIEKRKGIEGRADDQNIVKRLEEYRAYTEPSIEFFRSATSFVEVDGEPDIETIHKDIVSKLHVA
ncbi:MAG: nucleoside monophosphate kinase [Minisyncoccia bacterium]